MKRLLIAATAALLLCPVTAYAAPTEDAKAVYEELMNTTQNMTDMNAYYDMNLKMSSSMFKELGLESMDMRMEMNTRIKNMTDPQNMQYQAFTRVSMPDIPSQESCAYYANGYYYIDTMGQKIRYAMPLDQMVEQAMASASMAEASLDVYKDLTLQIDGENRILHYTIDDAKFGEYMDLAMGATGFNELLGDDASMSVTNIKGSYIINPEGYYTKAYLSMDMAMALMGESIQVSITADIGVADPGQPVTLSVPNPKEYKEMASPY